MKRRWHIRTLMMVVALVALGLGIFHLLAENQRLRTQLAAQRAMRAKAEAAEAMVRAVLTERLAREIGR